MEVDSLISTYGYFAIVLGVLLEGEAVVATAGVMASTGLLSLEAVMLCAFLGSVGTYHSLFLLGSRRGERCLDRFSTWRARAQRLRPLVYRYRIPAVLGYRLLYGLRSAIPLMLGMSGLRYRQFALLDLLPAVLWSAGVSSFGFMLGTVGHLAREYTARFPSATGVLAAVAVAFFIALSVLLWVTRKGRRASD